MALSKRQLEEITAAIKRRFLAFSYDALGKRALTEDELNLLIRTGLLRRGTRHFIIDPITLGKITAILPLSKRSEINYETVMRAVQNVPTTAVESRAIEYATDHAGIYIKGIGEMLVRDTEAVAARAGSTALRAVQEGVAEAIAKRETVKELKTRLFDMVDNSARDWHRVAHTEMNTAIQNGIANEIRAKSDDGGDQLIFRRPNPDACSHCKRLYLQRDGVTPRIFRLKDLADSNVGLRAADWQPVLGSTHPFCSCQTQVVPEGYDFKKMKTVTESFGEYKKGEIIDERAYEDLDGEEKLKVGVSAVLSYTGRTAQPTVEKSLINLPIEDDCICYHD